jgi:hypothetical protein
MVHEVNAPSRGNQEPPDAETGWPATNRRLGFSLGAAVAAFVGGFFLLPFVVFTVFNGWEFWGWEVWPVAIVWTFLQLCTVAIPLGTSIWLARRSRISLSWLIWPLLGAMAAGALGFVAWFASVWEPMD